MNNLKNEITKTLETFSRLCRIEKADDWQGKPTNAQTKQMLVQRNVVLSMSIPDNEKTLVDLSKPDLPWAEDHFQERVSGIPSNPGETYKYWPYHNNIENDKLILDQQFSHTYQERFWPKEVNNQNPINGGEGPNWGLRYRLGDYNDVVNLLDNNPTTRQAYLPIWFPEDTWAANNSKRVPCTLGYYFYIEDGYLCCHYIIRSCDLYRHFRNDIYITSRLLQHTAQLLGRPCHTLTMTIFNLHLFVNDKYMFEKKENIKI